MAVEEDIAFAGGPQALTAPASKPKTPYEEELDRRRKQAQADQQLRKYLGTLPPAERQQYMQGLQDNNAIHNPGAAQPISPAATEVHAPLHFSAYHAPQDETMSDAQQNAIDDVNDAIRKEMDRRVAISREQRRMAHEKELKRMELDALIARLGNAGSVGGGG